MLRVQFNNQKSMKDCTFNLVSDSVVELTGKKIPKNTSGFKMFRLNGEFLGDYSDFTEIAEVLPGGIRFAKKA